VEIATFGRGEILGWASRTRTRRAAKDQLRRDVGNAR
jgi:hypothetical protein